MIIDARHIFHVRRMRNDKARIAWRLKGWDRLPRAGEVAVYIEREYKEKRRVRTGKR